MSPLVRHAPQGGSLRVVVPLLAALLSAFFFSSFFLAPSAHAAVKEAAYERSRLEHPLGLTQLEELPFARDGAAAVATEDALYVIGGATKDGPTGRVDRYSFATEEWDVLTTDLIPRRHLTAVLIERQLYVFGGRGVSGGPVPDVEVVDIKSGNVTGAAPMPTPRYFASAQLHKGRVFVAGGTLGWGRLGVVEMYDPAANEWYVAPSLSVARDTQLVESGGSLYALGGYTGAKEKVSPVVEKLVGNQWVKVSEMPKATSSFSATAAGGLIFTFGDHRDPGRVLRFDPASGAWTELEVGFFPRRHSAAAAHGARLFVTGGSQRGSAHKLGTTELFDLSPGDIGTL